MNLNPPSAQPGDAPTTVYFDGVCPLCRREIAVYRRLRPLAPVRWEDVSRPDATLPEGLDRESAMARFHVRDGGGTLRSGAAAFVALWRVLPGWRWLARVASVPGVTALMELAYRAFLPCRPWLQRLLAPGEEACDVRCETAPGDSRD